jgi:hypothetical protein
MLTREQIVDSITKMQWYEHTYHAHNNRNRRRDQFFLQLPIAHKCNLIVAEIGVSCGINAKRIMDTLNPKELYLIDPWEFDNPEVTAHKYMKGFVYKLFEEHEHVEIKEARSIEGAKTFPDQYFDLVYIDALHDYENVTKDLSAWYPKIKTKGFLAGHDYNYVSKELDRNEVPVISAVNDFANHIKASVRMLTYPLRLDPTLANMHGSDGHSDWVIQIDHHGELNNDDIY